MYNPKVKTIQDCPEAGYLVKKFNRYSLKASEGYLKPKHADIIPGFSMGLSGIYLHFSLQTGYESKTSFSDEKVWAQWIPRRSEVLSMVHALTCPKEKLPPIALQEPGYTILNLKFIGRTKVMNCKTVAREIAIARMEGKI